MNLMPRPDLSLRTSLRRSASTPSVVTSHADSQLFASYPWWIAEADATGDIPPASPPLAEPHGTDVAIVGGGYTGLWTALTLRERAPGMRVVVLEAGSCGGGGSGRNGGFLHGYWEMFGKLTGLLGQDRALAVAQAGSEAQQAILRFCASRPEDVWLRNGGIGVVATSASQAATVAATLRPDADIPHEYRPRALNDAELTQLTNDRTFQRGALFPEGATVQPARLLYSMKNAAVEAGVQIYENSPVVQMRRGETTALRTPLGEMICRDAVLAANAWLSGNKPYAHYLTNLGSYAIVTEPLPTLLQEMEVRTGLPIKDARMFLHWTRTTQDNRIIVGTGAGPMSYGGRVSTVHTGHQPTVERCVAALQRFYPSIGEVRIDHAWGGPIDMSADRIPFFGTLPNSRVHYGAGFSGHGVNASWIGGQTLASLALGVEDKWTQSPFCHRQVPRFPPEPFRYLGGKAIHSNSLAVEDTMDRGEAPTWTRRTIAAIPRIFGLRIGLR